MITTGEMGRIIALKCKEIGIKLVKQADNLLDGEINEEQIVVIPKAENTGRIWSRAAVEVNILVPNKRKDILDLQRLYDLERKAKQVFSHRSVGTADGTLYRYSYESIGRISSATLRCGWINIKINFEYLNTKEK